MRKILIMTFMLVAIVSGFAYSQDKAPSYFEMDDYNHRYPETDTQIDMWLVNWQNSPVYSGSQKYGGWICRPYFTQGDPVNPPRNGAVLKYMKAYDHGRLSADSWTQKIKLEKEQAFFYITKGTGRVESGGKSVDLSEGTGIFVPAGVEFQIFNTNKVYSLEAIVVAEDITDDFVPLTEIKTGSYKDKLPSPGMHWAHIGRGIVNGAKFQNPVGFAHVSVDAHDMAQPHMHGPGVEEIWCQLTGDSLLMFGNQLRVQKPGMAFLIPPIFKIPHSSINGTDEPMSWLYMGNRHDPSETRSIEGHIPGWKGKIYDKYDIKY